MAGAGIDADTVHLNNTTGALSILATMVAGAPAIRGRFIVGMSRAGKPEEDQRVNDDVGRAGSEADPPKFLPMEDGQDGQIDGRDSESRKRSTLMQEEMRG